MRERLAGEIGETDGVRSHRAEEIKLGYLEQMIQFSTIAGSSYRVRFGG